jgi:exosortase
MTFADALRSNTKWLLGLLALLAGLYWKIVPDMVMDWYRDDNYSHGFLVPVITGYFLWQRWPELKSKLVKPDNLGLLVIILAALQLLVAWLGTEYFTMRSSLVVMIAGMVLYFFGRDIFRGMALPILFLLFMVPIPYIIYDMVAFPLKLFITKASVGSLQAAGISVLREGNIIHFPATTLEVADACSGIRSLMSLLALSVAYAFLLPLTIWQRCLLVFSTVPIAIATNAFRVIVTGVLAQYWGARVAQGFFHEFAGLAVFALAMVLVVGLGALLKAWGGAK